MKEVERIVKGFEKFFQLSGDSDMVQSYSGTCLSRRNCFLETKMKQIKKNSECVINGKLMGEGRLKRDVERGRKSRDGTK